MISLKNEAYRCLEDIAGKNLLRVGEAAEALSVSRWTIYRWWKKDVGHHAVVCTGAVL